MTGTSRSKRVIESITQAAKETEGQQREINPAPTPGKRSRAWEQTNKPTPIRLGKSDAAWLREFAASHSITIDTAGRGLIHAMRMATEQGRVSFDLEQEIEEYEDSLGRQRTRVHTELRTDWQIPRP